MTLNGIKINFTLINSDECPEFAIIQDYKDEKKYIAVDIKQLKDAAENLETTFEDNFVNENEFVFDMAYDAVEDMIIQKGYKKTNFYKEIKLIYDNPPKINEDNLKRNIIK